MKAGARILVVAVLAWSVVLGAGVRTFTARTPGPALAQTPTTAPAPAAATSRGLVLTARTGRAQLVSLVGTGATATPTTVGGIVGRIPRPAATLPFTTRKPNAHVSPVFAELSVAGGIVFLLLVAVQLLLTRPGRRGRRTL